MEKQVERLVPAPDRLARHFSEEIPTEPLSHQAFSLISTVAAAETLRDFARVPSLGHQGASGNEDLIDILTRI